MGNINALFSKKLGPEKPGPEKPGPRKPGPNIIPPAREHSYQNKTGSWKYFQPERVIKSSPCSNACPLNNDIQAAMRDVESGRYLNALQTFQKTNPLPAILGRICTANCETACSRNELDQSLSVRGIERMLGDIALTERGRKLKNPYKSIKRVLKRVAVVGAGPAGLGAAFQLSLKGIDVTIFDHAKEPGGLLVSAIPQFRLPMGIARAEISRLIENCGMEFIGGSGPGINMEPKDFSNKYDGLIVASGLGKPKTLCIPGEDTKGVCYALEYLAGIKAGRSGKSIHERLFNSRKRVVVIGGGDVGLDAARVALRTGAKSVTVIAPEAENNLPATREAFRLAKEEGVSLISLKAPISILSRKGKVTGIKLANVEWDHIGRMMITGPTGGINTDAVIIAIGQEREMKDKALHELSSLDRSDFPVGFAGELKLGPTSAAASMADGMLSADRLFARLMSKPAAVGTRSNLGALDSSDFKNLVGRLETTGRIEAPSMNPAMRLRGFDEVTGALSAYAASLEARRCIHCGSCTSCERCAIFCPDNSVRRAGDERYEFDLDHCKGCGICAEECPSKVIDMKSIASNGIARQQHDLDDGEDEIPSIMEVAG